MAQNRSDEYGNPTGNTGNTGLGTGDQQQKGHQGIGDKIKEKIPGMGKKDDQGQCCGPTGVGATNTQGLGGGTAKPDGYDAGTPQEKKGIVEKIKEKLPGGHK